MELSMTLEVGRKETSGSKVSGSKVDERSKEELKEQSSYPFYTLPHDNPGAWTHRASAFKDATSRQNGVMASTVDTCVWVPALWQRIRFNLTRHLFPTSVWKVN